MRYAMVGLFLLLGLAPLAFAESDACEQNCCGVSGGSWDEDFGSCSEPGSSYYSCINQCEGMAGTSVSCCGSAFVLAAVGAALFVLNGGKAAGREN
jgi:hypothetical protein